MKKHLLLLLFCFSAIAMFGQLKLEKQWEFSNAASNTPAWLGAGNTERSMAHYGGELYIPTRKDGAAAPKLVILNAADGSTKSVLSLTGIVGGHTFFLNTAGTTSDGTIILSSGATVAPYFYTLDKATGAATALFTSLSVTKGRVDGWGISGSMTDGQIMVPASGGTDVYVYTLSGGAVTNATDPVKFTNDNSSSAHAYAVDKDHFYIYSQTRVPQYFTKIEGNWIAGPDQFPATMPTAAVGAAQFSYLGKTYYVTPSTALGVIQVYDITDGLASATLVFTTEKLGDVTNAAYTVPVCVDVQADGVMIYVFATNNGIAAYKLYEDIPEPTVTTFKVGVSEVEPDFTSLKAAFDFLNTYEFTQDVELLVTSDLTEPLHVAFGGDTKGFNLTMRPDKDEDRTITFTQTADNGAPSGALIIGMTNKDNWNSLSAPKNVTIDGCASGGTTKRLKIKTQPLTIDASSSRYNGPVLIIGDAENIVIKNCIIEHGHQSILTGPSFGVNIRTRTQPLGTGTKYAPSNIRIENNDITDIGHPGGMGVGFSFAPGDKLASDVVVAGNTMTVTRRGMLVSNVQNLQVFENTFNVNQTYADDAELNEGIFLNQTLSGEFLIDANHFTQLKTAGKIGAAGVNISNNTGTIFCLISNNIFTGFSSDNANGTSRLAGITGAPGVGSIIKIHHNTILLNELSGTPTLANYTGISLSGNPDIKNNIIISVVDNIPNTLIGTLTTGESNYNLFYLRKGTTNAKIHGTYTDLLSYQSGVGKDANAKYMDVTFVSATDLHLDASMDGKNELGAPRSADVPTDIDFETRRAFTYVGADELTTELVDLPVNIDGAEIQQITIYPNPARESITVTLPDNQMEAIQVTLFDMSGRVVLKENTQSGETITVGHLPKGNYLVQVNCLGKTLKGKLIINK